MKRFLFKKVSSLSRATLIMLALLIIVPLVVTADPLGAPPTGNVDANFSSVQLPSGPKMTGSFGRYVALAAATTGNAGGYAGAESRCNAANVGSHVCTAKEIINSYEYNITLPGGKAWINNGPPAYVSDISNDCNGWTSNNQDDNPPDYSTYGSIWNFVKGQSLMATCGRSLPIACCAY